MSSQSPFVRLLVLPALGLLIACGGGEERNAKAVIHQALAGVAGIQMLRNTPEAIPRGPFDRAALMVLADSAAAFSRQNGLPDIAVADEALPGSHTPPGPHLRSAKDWTMHFAAESGGVFAVAVHNVTKGTCEEIVKTKPTLKKNLIFNRDAAPYLLGIIAVCGSPDPAVTLRLCAPRLGSCPDPAA